MTRQQQIAYDLCRSGAELRNRVLRAGYEAGVAGRPCPNTIDRTSPGYAAWMAGKATAAENADMDAEAMANS